MARSRVGYLGPEGSFSHEAVATLSPIEPVACASISDVLAGVADGRLGSGLVPLENAIEGLVFDHDLVIVREIVLPIHMHLLAKKGLLPHEVTRVSSYVHALAQVR